MDTERLWAKAKKEADKAALKVEAGTREAELMSEVEKCMVGHCVLVFRKQRA